MITLNQSIEIEQCYTDNGSFVINILIEDFFQDISNDGLTRLTMIKMIKYFFQ